MTNTASAPHSLINGWRIAGWGSLIALLILPAIAMQFSADVVWGSEDFIAAAILLGLLGLGVELAFRAGSGFFERAAIIAASLAAFLTLWATGAVGIIGNESLPINLAYPALMVAGIVAAIVVKGRPAAMLVIVLAVATSQLVIGLIAELTGTPDWGPVLFMTVVWLVPALLYRLARR